MAAWAGFTLLCPDNNDFVLRGNGASMIQKYFSLEITKCDSNVRSCATDTEIDTYYEDLQLDAWAVFEKMDFLLYGGRKEKPVFK